MPKAAQAEAAAAAASTPAAAKAAQPKPKPKRRSKKQDAGMSAEQAPVAPQRRRCSRPGGACSCQPAKQPDAPTADAKKQGASDCFPKPPSSA